MTDPKMRKLFSALTAKERALHVLHAFREDRKVEPLVTTTMPEEQEDEFSWFIRNLRTVNCDLGMLALVFELEVRVLYTRLGMLQGLRLTSVMVDDLATMVLELIPEEGNELLRDLARDSLAAIPDTSVVIGSIPSIPEEDQNLPTKALAHILDGLLRDVPLKWRQVVAVEGVIDEVNRRFGEDTAEESIRSAINGAKAMLQELAESLRVLGHEVELVDEPTEELEFFREARERWAKASG